MPAEQAAGSATDARPPWCLREVDLFADLSEPEMAVIAEAAPMRRYAAGELVHTPQHNGEALYILKEGRVRLFRVSPDGRSLTTALLSPGTVFGEMVVVGQMMHGSFAEAMEDVAVCVMGRDDVQRLLLGDARIAARIAEILGRRLAELERRLSDTVFASVPQRVAAAVVTLATDRPLARSPIVHVTHEQLAGLVGATRETVTKALGDLAEQGLLRLGRGRITVLDPGALRAAGAPDDPG